MYLLSAMAITDEELLSVFSIAETLCSGLMMSMSIGKKVGAQALMAYGSAKLNAVPSPTNQ